MIFTEHFNLAIPSLGETGYRTQFINSMNTIDSVLYGIETFTDAISSVPGFIKGNGSGGYTGVSGNFIKSPVAGVGATSVQTINSTSYVDITGSSVSYTPPSGATKVIYVYSCHFKKNDALVFLMTKLLIDGNTETDCIRDSSANVNTGRINFFFVVNAWTGAKTMKLQARMNETSTSSTLNQTYYFDGVTQNNNVSSHYLIFSI